MVFNSGVFVFFYCIVLIAYWSLQRLPNGTRIQNRFLLIASYFFYGYWDWIFLFLIFISTVVDYIVAISLENTTALRKRKWLLSVSVIVNLGLLGSFKYFDFFVGGFVSMARVIVPDIFPDGGESLLLKVILPVGISFYTFQTMSYTIDVYRRKIPAERNFLDFGLYVCFFPQLVAGPIERAGELIPQIKNRREFSMDNLQKGLWLILLGFFMKVYVADNLAPLVDQVYLNGRAVYEANPALSRGHGGFQVMMANVGFLFQIYGDFAGYSSIALGTALLMGIKLSDNFNQPELSENPVELWRRWHVTLNRWITDYVYITLGGNRIGGALKLRNIIIIFVLMGFWHGANWTYVLWGLYHGLWMVLYRLSKPYLPVLPEATPRSVRTGVRFLKIIGVMAIFSFSGILFRAYNLEHSIVLLRSLLDLPWDLTESINRVPAAGVYTVAIFKKVALLLALDIAAFRYGDSFWIFRRPLWLRVVVYSALLYAIIILGDFGKEVIYFAF